MKELKKIIRETYYKIFIIRFLYFSSLDLFCNFGLPPRSVIFLFHLYLLSNKLIKLKTAVLESRKNWLLALSTIPIQFSPFGRREETSDAFAFYVCPILKLG